MNLVHLCVLVFAFSLTSGCWSPVVDIGTIYPRDSNYKVGEDVELECVLNKTSKEENGITYHFNSSSLYFKHGPERLKDVDIDRHSELEARLLVKNGQEADSGNYYCFLSLGSRADTLVCNTIIKFGHSPKDAENFKCRSYNLRNLTCTWTIPENTASVTYRLSYYPSHMYNVGDWSCPVMYQKKNSCQWNLSSSPTYVNQAPKLIMKLRGTNGLQNDSYQVFEIDHYSIVVPGKPDSIIMRNITSTQMFLNWSHPKELAPRALPPGICYRIKYKSSYDADFMSIDVEKQSEKRLTGLYPNTWYTVNVMARSCSADPKVQDLWGQEESQGSRTAPDIPWFPPEIEESFFEVVNFKQDRTVTVYWKHIEPKNRNGDNFHYEVSIRETYLHRRRRDVSNDVTEESVKTNQKSFMNLDMNSTYVVRIRSVNSVGSSINDTEIIIPKDSEKPEGPLHVRPVYEGGGKFQVSWDSPTTAVGGYTVIWCLGEYRCQNSLQWINVNASTTTVTLQLQDNNNYDFAVGATSVDGTLGSGLEWAPCTIQRSRVVDRIPVVKAEALSSRKIKVSWKLACEAQKAVVQKYQVYMCKTKCPASTCMGKENITVSDPLADYVEFDHLRPYTSYGFSVVAISEAGRTPESTVTCKVTPSDAPSDPPNSVILFSSTNNTMTVSWKPPENPNGVVDLYKIHYNEVNGRPDQNFQGTYEYLPYKPDYKFHMFNYTLRDLKCFTNYSITVSACVEKQCSNLSKPLYEKTKIGVPGPMDPPRTEVVNISHVRVIWSVPEQTNGPIDFYLLHRFKREAGNLTRLDLVNVSSTSVVLSSDCSPDVHTSGEGAHLFSVQAVNLLAGQEYLYGPISNTTETKLCFVGADMNSALVIGIIVGSTLALAFVILCLYSVLRWMKSKVMEMKDVSVILPGGLQQPYSHSNSYENFRNGLSRQSSDPNLSPKLGYGGMDPFNGNHDNNNSEDSFKNRHGSGASHFSATSTDELICKQTQGGQVTSPRNMSTAGQKITGKSERNPSGDSSSGHDSISSSLTHRTNLSSDGSSSSEDPHAHGKDAQSSRDSGLDEESKPFGGTSLVGTKAPPQCPSPSGNGHYLPTAPYSKLGFLESGRIGSYLPLARGRHLSLYSHNMANSEPSITDLNQESYVLDQPFQHEPPSPDVPYSKFGMSHSVTDLMLDGMESPDSPLSSHPSPQEALPYSRFGLRRPLLPSQNNSPYVTMGMALLMGPQKDPNQILGKVNPTTLVLKPPVKKEKPLEQEKPAVLTVQDEAYSKLGLVSLAEQKNPPLLTQPYLTMQEVKNSECNHSLPDLTKSSREESPSHQVPEVFQHGLTEVPSKSGYLPHQLSPSVKSAEPELPDLVNCSSVLPVSVALQETPEVKVQGNNGYVSLNQVLASNTKV